MRKSRILLDVCLKADYNIKKDYGENMFAEDNLFDILVIDCYINANKLTKKEFCARCGIDYSILKKNIFSKPRCHCSKFNQNI